MSPRATSRRWRAPTIENHPKLYKQFYGQPSFTWGKTLGSGADITQANRNPLLGRVAGADGLKTGHTDEAGYGFTGSAEQNGRRLIMVVAGLDSFNQRIEESVAADAVGLQRLAVQAAVQGRRQGRHAPRSSSAATARSAWSRRATSPSPFRRACCRKVDQDEDPLSGPGQGADRQGPAYRRPGRHHRRHAAADRCRWSPPRTVGEAGFFGRIWIGLKQLFGLA